MSTRALLTLFGLCQVCWFFDGFLFCAGPAGTAPQQIKNRYKNKTNFLPDLTFKLHALFGIETQALKALRKS
jgi:hypothetical protein